MPLPADRQSTAPPATVPAPSREGPAEIGALTSELMQDECVRGDFVIRWMVVLLALLLGCTYITETSLLVDIRSGQHMISHGLLPPRTDVFSATAGDRPWVNLHWLSDLAVAAVHDSLGMAGLSILSALTLAVSFYLLTRLATAGVSTWWGAVCSAVAVVAVFPAVQPGASTVTLLGLAALVWCLSRSVRNPSWRGMWGLPVLFLLWGNLDSRAWIGMLVLALFAIGSTLTVRGQTAGWLWNWIPVGVSLLVGIFANPWPGQPVLAIPAQFAATRAGADYDRMSEFFPWTLGLTDRYFWQHLDVFAICSLALLAVSLVTVVLNVKQLHLGRVALWLGVNVLSLFSGELATYAALVNAAVATVNGQAWYARNFSQAYSVRRRAVVFARSGRAATVLSLFVLAYLAVNGALMGAGSRRIGTGLDPRWQDRISSLDQTVLEHTFSDRIFPMLPSQGDISIWLGKKPFVDGRLSLYLEGDENLLATHQAARRSLFAELPPKPDGPDPTAWEPVFDKYQITETLIRLGGDEPNYRRLIRLMVDRRWSLTGLGAAGANFTRLDADDPGLVEHADRYRVTRFSQAAFQPAQRPPVVELPTAWPQPQVSSDRWLIQRLPRTPQAAQLAGHYQELLQRLAPALSPHQIVGLAFLAIRECRRALAEDLNNPLAYRVLAEAYAVLQQMEQVTIPGSPRDSTFSFFVPQRDEATFRAVRTGGTPDDLLRLFRLQFEHEDLDAARDTLRRFDELASNPRSQAEADELAPLRQQLDDHLKQVSELVDQARSQGAPLEQLAAIALDGKCPLVTLSLIEQDQKSLTEGPARMLAYVGLLVRVGRTEEAYALLERLTAAMTQQKLPPEATPYVREWNRLLAEVHLAAGDVSQAIKVWSEQPRTTPDAGANALMHQPFASAMVSVQQDLWSATTGWITGSIFIDGNERWAHWQLETALAELEQGKLSAATQRLKDILTEFPEYSRRPLAVFYLNMLSNVQYEAFSPSDAQPPEFKSLLDQSETEPRSEESAPVPPSPALPEAIPND